MHNSHTNKPEGIVSLISGKLHLRERTASGLFIGAKIHTKNAFSAAMPDWNELQCLLSGCCNLLHISCRLKAGDYIALTIYQEFCKVPLDIRVILIILVNLL